MLFLARLRDFSRPYPGLTTGLFSTVVDEKASHATMIFNQPKGQNRPAMAETLLCVSGHCSVFCARKEGHVVVHGSGFPCRIAYVRSLLISLPESLRLRKKQC